MHIRKLLGAAVLAAALGIAMPALGTVSTTASSVTYTGNGSTTAFTVPFKFLSNSDLVVTVTDTAGNAVTKVLSTDYSVSGAGASTGTVTFTTAPPSSYVVRIRRAMALTQPTSLRSQTSFSPTTHEAAFDRLTMQVQQLQDQVSAPVNPSPLTNLSTVIATGGSTARTLQDRFGELASLKDFNAQGDGSTDDTVALNAAGASGKRILVPPGTYVAKGNVALSAGTVFYAVDPSSSILLFNGGSSSAPGNAAISLNGVGAGIEGLGVNVTAGDYRRVVDHRASYTSTRRCKLNFTSPNVNAAAFAYVLWVATGVNLTNVVLDGNDIQGNATNLSDGVQASNAPGIRVTNNRIHDFTTTQTGDTKFSWAIYVSSACPGAVISSNRVENVNVSGIHKNDSSPDPGASITDNYVSSCTNVGISVQKATGAVIRGNRVYSCDLLFSLDSANATVSGNIFDTVVTRAAGAINANKPLIELTTTAAGSTFTGNVFGAAGNAVYAVDNANGATDVTFTGNEWLSTSPSFPIISAGARTALVGNTIAWTGTSYPSLSGADSIFANNIVNVPTGGVGVRATGNNAQVHGNRIIGGNYAVWVSSGTGASVRNNIASGQASTVYNFSGATNVVARGNKYGTGALQGTATLVAGTVTVSTTEVQAGDTVVLSRTTSGGTPGHLSVGTITAGTSFVINSSSGTDTSVIAWEIVH